MAYAVKHQRKRRWGAAARCLAITIGLYALIRYGLDPRPVRMCGMCPTCGVVRDAWGVWFRTVDKSVAVYTFEHPSEQAWNSAQAAEFPNCAHTIPVQLVAARHTVESAKERWVFERYSNVQRERFSGDSDPKALLRLTNEANKKFGGDLRRAGAGRYRPQDYEAYVRPAFKAVLFMVLLGLTGLFDAFCLRRWIQPR